MDKPVSVAEAREAARRGRAEQLETLARFEKGEPVVFKVHNKEGGYPLSKDKVKPTPRQGGARIRFTDADRLQDAAVLGDLSEVQQLIEGGCDPNVRDADRLTPLHRACVENHLSVVSYLVSKGANVNAIDRDWWTPLHAASSAGNWRVANFLISHGANVAAANAEGDLPIDVVSDSKVEGVIQREMERLKISEDSLDKYRTAPQQRLMEDTEKAIKAGQDLNSKNKEGATKLHVAACNGWIEVVKLLVKQPSVKVNARDSEGNTPLHLAAFFQQYEVVLLLATNGADLTARNVLNEKPIIVTEDETMIRLLSALEKKAKTGKIFDPAKEKRRSASTINRSTRAKKRADSRRDSSEEGKLLTTKTGGHIADEG